jgi:hypothetical protein
LFGSFIANFRAGTLAVQARRRRAPLLLGVERALPADAAKLDRATTLDIGRVLFTFMSGKVPMLIYRRSVKDEAAGFDG